jgi:hypothetical protein
VRTSRDPGHCPPRPPACRARRLRRHSATSALRGYPPQRAQPQRLPFPNSGTTLRPITPCPTNGRQDAGSLPCRFLLTAILRRLSPRAKTPNSLDQLIHAREQRRWNCEASTLAVLRLMRSSNLVGCSTGTSAGSAPFKTLSAISAARRTLLRARAACGKPKPRRQSLRFRR